MLVLLQGRSLATDESEGVITMLRTFLFIIGLLSFPAIGLPGSGSMAALAIVVVGWAIIDRLDDLNAIVALSESTAAALRRAATKRGE